MSARRHVVVLGDALLDRDLDGHVERVCPDAPAPVLDVATATPRPGGAGLTALLCAADGVEVSLVAPVADDSEGHELCALLEASGVRVQPLGHEGATRVKTRLRSDGQSIARVDTGGPGRPVGGLTAPAVDLLTAADVVLVSCYGAGTTDDAGIRALLSRRAPRRPVVWDPHPRGAVPVPGCALVTPNLPEARGVAGLPDAPGDVVARHLVTAWGARAVAVTGGAVGAWVATSSGDPLFAPARPAHGDSCGAGDRFASAAAVALASGRTTTEAVVDAVASAGEFVAAGGASGLRVSAAGAGRPSGSTSHTPIAQDVAGLRGEGGCFDVLHAGHVSTLEAARALGDRLVVLLNSDASVRRLKGPSRPVHRLEDRARVLLGLSCVDAVVPFDEPDPCTALARLRPDIWAKGGDYEDTVLPEAPLVRSWGGRVVLLPYLSGRSTTAVLQSIESGDLL